MGAVTTTVTELLMGYSTIMRCLLRFYLTSQFYPFAEEVFPRVAFLIRKLDYDEALTLAGYYPLSALRLTLRSSRLKF